MCYHDNRLLVGILPPCLKAYPAKNDPEKYRPKSPGNQKSPPGLSPMKKYALAATILLASVPAVLAQGGGSYTVDNFDFANSVRIETPQVQSPSRQLSRKTRLKAPQDLAKTRLIETTILNRLADIKASTSLAGFTTGNSTVDSFIVESGSRNAVDPLLLYSIMHQESTFKQHALSPKGARGLMQLMPPTARRFGVLSIFDPRQNIEGGARYMRFLLDHFQGNVQLALAGYNAGEGAVMKYGNRIPPYRETQEYVRRISKRYSLIRDPLAARNANSLTRQELAAVRQKETVPLTIYEQSVFAVQLPNGRLQLISQ